MDLKLDGHTALITASSSGLGKATAESFVKEGANVVINGLDEKKLNETAKELRNLGKGKVLAVKADITSKDDIEMLIEKTIDEFGRLDHLVTSAGGPPAKSFLDTTEEDWYFSYDLLVMSVVRIVKAAYNYLKKDGGGTIVNITSVSVKEAIEGLVLSNSVRMSVIGLMKTLAKELAPEIRSNAILQGYHETQRIVDLFETSVDNGKFENYDDAKMSKTENIPLKKIGDPSKLGDFITYLSSDKSSYINGSSIVIDGGESKSNI